MKAGLAARVARLEHHHPTEAWPPLLVSYHGEPLLPALREPCLIVEERGES